MKFTHHLLVFGVWCLAGCASQKSQVSSLKAEVINQMPQATMHAIPRTAVLAPAFPPTVRLDWTQNFDPWNAPDELVWQVWATTNLAKPFTLKSVVTSTNAVFAKGTAEFYMVRTSNTVTHLTSDWGMTR